MILLNEYPADYSPVPGVLVEDDHDGDQMGLCESSDDSNDRDNSSSKYELSMEKTANILLITLLRSFDGRLLIAEENN
jgi:hypothetical protein